MKRSHVITQFEQLYKNVMCISPCRLMNIWIYLHKACTKLLQLTVIGWTITLLSKMAGEGFFFFCWSNISLVVLIFDLHMYCDDMLINWNRPFLFYFSLVSFVPLPLFVVVTGCLTCTVLCPSWCVGLGSTFQTLSPTLALVSKTFWSPGRLLTTERGSRWGFKYWGGVVMGSPGLFLGLAVYYWTKLQRGCTVMI